MITSTNKCINGTKTFEAVLYQIDHSLVKYNILNGKYRRLEKTNKNYPVIAGYQVEDRS